MCSFTSTFCHTQIIVSTFKALKTTQNKAKAYNLLCLWAGFLIYLSVDILIALRVRHYAPAIYTMEFLMSVSAKNGVNCVEDSNLINFYLNVFTKFRIIIFFLFSGWDNIKLNSIRSTFKNHAYLYHFSSSIGHTAFLIFCNGIWMGWHFRSRCYHQSESKELFMNFNEIVGFCSTLMFYNQNKSIKRVIRSDLYDEIHIWSKKRTKNVTFIENPISLL